MERLVKRRTALALLGMPAALSLGSVLTGCSKNAQDSALAISATDLTADVKDAALTQEPIANALTDQTTTHALFDFTSRLLQGTYPTDQQTNVLVSPLSALFALALAETGAAGVADAPPAAVCTAAAFRGIEKVRSAGGRQLSSSQAIHSTTAFSVVSRPGATRTF